ncbi:hypothetical protein SAMN05444484_102149 [Flavobacterium chilense]|uniref:Uncharacterized protein n=1 Tax=Flavobacterium chilense TaxID=946677 RepID=A0A1M7CGT2_9FLAO|nr:hypothetical protein SAMN05444484_102149 [Flavobacterium chilense]
MHLNSTFLNYFEAILKYKEHVLNELFCVKRALFASI